jgi:hypothetical protein
MSAATRHLRDEASVARGNAELNPAKRAIHLSVAEDYERAATVLEALAVPGVALWLARMANATDIYGKPVTDDQRAALATLARLAKEDR